MKSGPGSGLLWSVSDFRATDAQLRYRIRGLSDGCSLCEGSGPGVTRDHGPQARDRGHRSCHKASKIKPDITPCFAVVSPKQVSTKFT